MHTPHTAPAIGRAARYKVKIGDVRKNSCERIEARLEEYNGADLINLAVIRDDAGNLLNRMKGTTRIVSTHIRLLPELIDLLRRAEAEAVKRSLLTLERKA